MGCNGRNSSFLKTFVVLFVVINWCCVSSIRNKRFLVWPEGPSRVQAIMGVGIPVDLEDETVIIGIVLKAMYFLPTNSSYYTSPNILYARKKRSMSRWDIYSLLSNAAELYGFGGKACVLRAICEVGDTAIDRRYSLIDEIAHAVFTPTSTKEEVNHHTDYEYYAAHQLGNKVKGRCGTFFPECKRSLMDRFSRILSL